jgi:DNA polymerase III alpha subunit (gram-positive type)
MEEGGEKFLELIDPQVPIPDRAFKAHGIGEKQVRGKPTFGAVWKLFSEFVKRTEAAFPRGVIVFVGHNSASYDNVLLHAELQRIKASVDDLSDKPILSADTLVAARAARKAGKIPKGHPLKLSSLYEHFTGKPLEGAHDALVDSTAVAKIFSHPCIEPFVSYQPFSEGKIKLQKRVAQHELEGSSSCKKQKSEGVKITIVNNTDKQEEKTPSPEATPPPEATRLSSILLCPCCRRVTSRFFPHLCT